MSDRFELSTGVYEFTRTGIRITGESTQKDWELLGEGLRAIDEARQWAIGDWLCDGKRHYGDGLYKRAAELTETQEQTLRTFASMSSQFELLRRHNNLTFQHHREVASIKPIFRLANGKLSLDDKPDDEKIAECLALAVKNNWSVAELRGVVKKYKEQQREYIRLANEPEKYSVIYADPPWQYTSGDQHTDETQDTVLGDHYPSMSLAELCEMPVAEMAATDAVLWLWVASHRPLWLALRRVCPAICDLVCEYRETLGVSRLSDLLMEFELRVMQPVLKEISRTGGYALPLHDAVLVPESTVEHVREIVLRSGRFVFGFFPCVTTK